MAAATYLYPYFVTEKPRARERIPHFPGVYRWGVDTLLRDMQASVDAGVRAFLLFGVPQRKDREGSGAWDEQSAVCRALRHARKEFGTHVTLVSDVCLCAYTDHGHCAILRECDGGVVDRDPERTLTALARSACAHADAGADWVAPSAMARHQVSAIRRALDDTGMHAVRVMGYSAKFDSNFYGPFRNAARSAPRFGDRKSYQLDGADRAGALARIREDESEGAAMVIVKPALAYLDIISDAAGAVKVPVAAYNVSGEYTMVKEGARKGLWRERAMVEELMTSIARAGASTIISYHARELMTWRKERGLHPEYCRALTDGFQRSCGKDFHPVSKMVLFPHSFSWPTTGE
ncbi:MAG: porphobilinogen synthase [Lentisphaerae bacterium]|nr:porphobilinogen synthase [Lentisphaerota bacterium]